MAIRKKKSKRVSSIESSTQTKNQNTIGENQAVCPSDLDVKKTAQINRNILLNKEKDDQLMETLARFAVKLGYLKPPV